MRPIIYPYKMGSGSARALADSLSQLRSKRVYPDRKYKPFSNHLIINWGNTELPSWYVSGMQWINHPEPVSRASNKLTTLDYLQGHEVDIPEFTTRPDEAESWLRGGELVVARTLLRANSGRGIVLMGTDDQLVRAPLYTKYFKKMYEYRIHVLGGQVIDIQHKRRSYSTADADVNYQIRNRDNGWIFARNNMADPDQSVLTNAVSAVEGLGLDFGAVDVAYNDHYKKACVFEVNTAPGLEGTTLEKYCQSLTNLL